MKKQILLLFFSFFTTIVLAQNEANIWYFGYNAGLDFNSGTPVVLTNGALTSDEGCATISNAAGQLLFYTDGVTVYNRNHQVMVNGAFLYGASGSTQSATIVPLPGSSTLYYVFTITSSAHAHGFRYSIVDISLNGGLGAVTSDKNVEIYAPSCEKISIIKHANNTDFWVVTHAWGNNEFKAYLLTATGLSALPVTSAIGSIVVQDYGGNAQGYMKISSDGSKLAVCHGLDLGLVELFNFDAATGLVSNHQQIFNEGGNLYGVEFSPNSEVLYISNNMTRKLYQFNLNSSNIPASRITLFEDPFTWPAIIPGALQLGPDGRIYLAQVDTNKLGIITDPNVIGVGCGLLVDAIDLAGALCWAGLPSFNQSFFFNPFFVANNTCVGQLTTFEIQTSRTISSVVWDFGDGNSSTDISPTHTYAAPGIYSVSVHVTTPEGTVTETRNITISAVPTATQPQDIKVCDANNDGFYTFDLTTQNSTILNIQSNTQYSIRYFANATDYSNNIAITNPTLYLNAAAYQQQTIIAEVSNNANNDCKAVTSFAIQVFENPFPALSANISAIRYCDNATVGTDTDGRVLFDLTQNATTVLNGQSAALFSLTYYKDFSLTQLITTPSNYANTNLTETIWVKMANIQNPNCFAVTSFAIQVFSLPMVSTSVSLKQCDDNQDGFSIFNLEEAIPLIASSTTGLTFSFFETTIEAQNNNNPIVNQTVYVNQIVNSDLIFVRVQNADGCYRVVPLNLIVSTTQIPNTFQQLVYTVCDDVASGSNSDGVATFDFSSADGQIRALFPVGQPLIITYYRNLADALAEQNAILDISNYSNVGFPTAQNIYVRVDSQLNNECLGLGDHITLNVERIPIVQSQILKHCDDNHDGMYAFDTTNLQNTLLNGLTGVMVTYKDQNGNPLPSPLPNPFSTTSQTISVVVSNTSVSACNYSTTVQFIVDDLPEAFQIPTFLTTVCDDEIDPVSQNGMYAFNTSTFESTILGNQTGMIVRYFDANSIQLPSPLPNPYNSGTQNLRVEVINPVNPSCSATMVIPLVVNEVPVIALSGEELVCSDNPNFTKTITAGLLDETTIGDYTYTWYLNNNLIIGESNYALTVSLEGIYTVEVRNANGCVRTRTITVTASDIATITDIEVTDLSNNNSIVVTVSGQGDYVYSLNNVDFQQSNSFLGLEAGVYTVYVKDLNGCGIANQEISVLGIPNFFTPNADGYNDYWNIKGVGAKYTSKTTIYVFNRYGKLLKQLSPHSQGWDGTYNGQSVPSDDYWYVIELLDGRIFKGHFSLKR